MQELKQHPFGAVFPALGIEEGSKLALDLVANGLQNPIVLFEGKVLDGWNRYIHCTAKGVPMRFTEYKGDDPIAFVISQNLVRRHLSVPARAHLANKLLAVEKKRAKERQKSKPGRKVSLPSGDGNEKKHRRTATAQAAKRVGVSASSVERMAAVDKHAVPEVREAVNAGKMSLKEAARVSKLPKREQKKAAEQPEQSRREANPEDDTFNKIVRLLSKASPSVRHRVVDWLRNDTGG